TPSRRPPFKSSACAADIEPIDQADRTASVTTGSATSKGPRSSIHPIRRRNDSVAILSPRGADRHAPAGVGHNRRRFVRSPDEFDEPGRRSAVDALARAGDSRAARRRQFFLHGLPIHADARPGPSFLTRAMALAETDAVEMARGRIARRLSMGLRGLQPLG